MNASIEILVWIGMGVVAITHHFWLLGESLKDLRALREKQLNGIMMAWAKATIRRESIRLSVQIPFLIIGLWALFTPPVHPGRTVKDVTGALLFMIPEALIALNSVLDARVRRQLNEAARKEIGGSR